MTIEFSRPGWDDIGEAVAFLGRMWAILIVLALALIWSSLGTLIVHKVFADTVLMSDTVAARGVFWSLQMPFIAALSYVPLFVMGLFKGDAGAYTHMTATVFGLLGMTTFVVNVVLGWGPMPV
jgi:hypothetical protein